MSLSFWKLRRSYPAVHHHTLSFSDDKVYKQGTSFDAEEVQRIGMDAHSSY